jgi:hypothetical protein
MKEGRKEKVLYVYPCLYKEIKEREEGRREVKNK